MSGRFHRRGIGKALFAQACQENFSGKMTVNSSPFAVPVYHQLGFKDSDNEQVVNGLRFTPMECMNDLITVLEQIVSESESPSE